MVRFSQLVPDSWFVSGSHMVRADFVRLSDGSLLVRHKTNLQRSNGSFLVRTPIANHLLVRHEMPLDVSPK